MKRATFYAVTVSLALSAWSVAQGAEASAATNSPPPLPKIVELKAHPASLTLLDGRDERRVLILGKSEVRPDGQQAWLDLSEIAEFKPESAIIEVGEKGYV